MSAVAKGLVVAARLYQRTLAWLVPVHCRFHPSCSHYFVEAVERHGAGRGFLLGVWRLLRCQPLARGGFDPVPPVRRAADQERRGGSAGISCSRTERTEPPAPDR